MCDHEALTCSKKQKKNRTKDGFLSSLSSIGKFFVSAFLVITLLKNLFFGGIGGSNYYYYESSVYETRTYSYSDEYGDGNNKIIEKSSSSRSIKSNIPGLKNVEVNEL